MATLIPLFLFMLIPLWIPIIAVAVGWIGDLLGRRDEGFKVSARQPEAQPHLVAVEG